MRRLCGSADAVLEGYRPGVMERLGLGPEVLLADNPNLVYGRMTGWGQDGPYRLKAGHDINYIAISGALHASGRAGEKPYAPLNLVGDFGGGAMMMAFGMLSALLHVRGGGRGQVVDCSMADGAALLMTSLYSMKAIGAWQDERGVNTLDSGAHFYDTYETADGRYVALGSVEPEFYRALLQSLGLDGDGERGLRRKRRGCSRLRARPRVRSCRRQREPTPDRQTSGSARSARRAQGPAPRMAPVPPTLRFA